MHQHDILRPSSKKLTQQSLTHHKNLDHVIKSLEDEIQLSIYNYQHLLQIEKNNTTKRAEFLLYLVQSLRIRHMEELEALSMQITTSENEKQSAQSMQKQMENIGDGLDQIMQQSSKLKSQNEQLLKQLQQNATKEKQIDSEMKSLEQEMDQIKQKIDQWQKIKIKWNKYKKQLLEMIEDAHQNVTTIHTFNKDQIYSIEDKSVCNETGLDKIVCDHCENNKIEMLQFKYNMINNNNMTNRRIS